MKKRIFYFLSTIMFGGLLFLSLNILSIKKASAIKLIPPIVEQSYPYACGTTTMPLEGRTCANVGSGCIPWDC